MLIYAHRGLSSRFPENTLLAFREALAAGVEGIELDVHVTSDGVPVVIHDRELSRTTNGTGNVDDTPFDYLQTFDAGFGERVPSLRDVLELVADKAHLDIEIKGLGAEQATLDVLREHPDIRWAISSFDWNILRRVRGLDATAELWPLSERVDDALLRVSTSLDASSVSLWAGDYSEDHAALLQQAGLRTVVWTVNDVEQAERLRGLGAYGLCTDVPDLIVQATGQR